MVNGKWSNRKCVVVGGGNVAIDAARVAKRSGAVEVTMLSLETEDIMPASLEERTEARQDGVVINPGWGPVSINPSSAATSSAATSSSSAASSITFKRCLSVFDEEHRFAPKFDENETLTLDADLVIFAIGQTVVLKDLLKDTKVEFFRGVFPMADKLTYQTAEEDIFVGGDCHTGPKFAIDAIAAGKEAAESLHRFVQHGHMTIGRNRQDFIMLDKDNIVVESYDNGSRQIAADINPSSAATSSEATSSASGTSTSEATSSSSAASSMFSEYHGTFTEEQVRRETARCLGCGASVVDTNKCIGCGLCTTKCAFDAIHLTRDLPEASHMVTSEDKFSAILPYMVKRAKNIVIKGLAKK